MELPLVRSIAASAVHCPLEFLVTATMMVQAKISAGEVIGKYVGQVVSVTEGLFVLSRGCDLGYNSG